MASTKERIEEENKGGTVINIENTKIHEEIREDLVRTAVKFLENSKVQNSTEKMKRDFLTKKGLTEEEISLAFSRQMPVKPLNPVNPQPPVLLGQQQKPLMVLPHSTFSSKLRDFLNILVLIGGTSYCVKYLWKVYISPWLFGPAKKEKSPHEMILETSRAVLSSVEQLQQTVMSLKGSLENHSTKMEEMSRAQIKPEETGAMQDIKAEIQSVKGLLLSSFVSENPSPLSTGGGSSLTRRSPFKNGIISPSQLLFPKQIWNSLQT